MRSEDGNTVLVFNGEIYNNTAFREELRGLGAKFRSRCDTETVLAAFECWDTDCFEKLRGMFAIAIWSERSRRLVLARDRMGIKPLYFSRRGPNLYFGSELKALFAHPEIERNIDAEALHYFTSLNYVPSPLTMVQGIEKLAPGSWLEWDNGRVRTSPYWRLRLDPNLAKQSKTPPRSSTDCSAPPFANISPPTCRSAYGPAAGSIPRPSCTMPPKPRRAA